jgi:hypothetical protein
MVPVRAGRSCRSQILHRAVASAQLPLRIPSGVWPAPAVRRHAVPVRAGRAGVAADVTWEIAKDDSFKQIVATGEETAVASEAHWVHAELHGLQPGFE